MLQSANPRALLGREFGKPEHPVARRPVRRAGVDQARVRIRDERRGFARSGVRQAEKRDVGRVQKAGALARVLAQIGRGAQHLDIASPREELVNAKARRAFLTIDKNACRHAGLSERDRQHKAERASMRRAPIRDNRG